MAIKKPASAASPRPFWVPAEIDFEKLPEAVRVAFRAVIAPAYEELVVGAVGALERSAGVTLVFLLSLELVDQFELGRDLTFWAGPGDPKAEQRDQLISRHLRVIGAKQHTANFVLRLKEIRMRRGPAFADSYPDVMGAFGGQRATERANGKS
jgi:hypothetical protein